MTTLLVTGGAGFVGSHTCLTLVLAGYDIIVFDSCSTSSSISIDRVKCLSDSRISSGKISLINGDIRNFKELDKVFHNAKEYGEPISAVLHFAGLKAVRRISF